MSDVPGILVVRLGAMGDIIHTLPAVASLKHSMPRSQITWVVESKWMPLLQGNPFVEKLIPFDRSTLAGFRSLWRRLRESKFAFAVDFQGLIKSAMVATMARPERLIGFDTAVVRERPASWFYSKRVHSDSAHVVDQYVDLAVGAGASNPLWTFPLPQGTPEGTLPAGEFVLASPHAGWGAKQWPFEHYSALGLRLRREFGIPLVLNGVEPIVVENTVPHVSGLAGLIHATRSATAVVGLDSGPLHIAVAVGKTGVAIYGPTDPARNGPYGTSFTVLRSPGAIRNHQRIAEPDTSMRAITPEQVFGALASKLEAVRQ
jgi:heptosyltransferase-1